RSKRDWSSDVCSSDLEEHLADNRAVHNFAKYVTNFIVGYMVGVPLKTNYEEDEAVDKLLRDINVKNDADEHNSELVMNLSIYGRSEERSVGKMKKMKI